MSSHQQEQTEIMQTCNKINQMLRIPQEQFSLQALTHIDWYMTVLQMIYPQLDSKFEQIKRIENEAIAIDKLLFMLTQEEVIEEDFLEIKGQDIIEGDIQSVYYIVQLLNALIERENDEQGEEQQDGQEEEDGHKGYNSQPQGEDNQHEDNQEGSDHNEQDEEQYSNDFEQEPQSSNNSPQKPSFQHPPANNLPKPTNNDPHIFKNVFNHYDSQDEPSRQEERHSVLGIKNEFEDEDQDQEEEEEIVQPYSSGGKQSQNNATFGQKSQGVSEVQQQQKSLSKPNNQPPMHSSNQANIFSNTNQQKQQAELVATGYKMTKNQPKPQKKQFSSSSEQEAELYEQPAKKPTKVSKPSKDETEEEDDNEYFINPTIKKYKSDQKLIKTAGSGSKKSTTKKNIYKYASPTVPSKQSKKLVSHPTIKKQYRKAANPQAKKLTQEVKTQASMILKKKKKPVEVSSIINPAATEMERKAKQLKVKLADWKKESKIHEKRKLKTSSSQSRTNMELGRILNWRQGQLKKEKEEFEKAMELKLQVQKQGYIKKINSLLIKLQKEKQLYQRQQYKQQLLQQNQQAAKRLTAIQQWYKDKIGMLKESNTINKKERTLMHTGHKEILKQIEKDLKRQNQKQIMAMTMKYRRQEAQVENDLQELEREIIKVYKRN